MATNPHIVLLNIIHRTFAFMMMEFVIALGGVGGGHRIQN